MDKVSTSLSLMRRLPPNKIEQNLTGLLNLVPEETDEILQRVDQPLEEVTDTDTGRSFLICDYNRDGDSHRSPWSNKYFPALDDGFLPSERLRSLEVEMNLLFDAYRELYYEGGTSSVYLWDLDGGFAGCFLVKKAVEDGAAVKNGTWDAIHVVEVKEDGPSRASYKLTTTIMLYMSVEKIEIGETNMAGSLTRQAELTSAVNETKTHIANMGRMIEDMENTMRANMRDLYIMKTKEIVTSIFRSADSPLGQPGISGAHITALGRSVADHAKTRAVDSESV